MFKERYVQGEEPRVFINHPIIIDAEIDIVNIKMMFQLSNTNHFYSLALMMDDTIIRSEKVIEQFDFEWNRKIELGDIAITPDKQIPLVLMTADLDEPLLNVAEYIENPDLINKHSDIIVIAISFETEWDPGE